MALDMQNKELIWNAAHVAPAPRQLAWQEMELTAFIHFTVNTFTDKEWGDGSELPEIFNPVECDPRQWCRVLKESGFKMAILTAKHHDGFCLWPSAYTDHSIKNSPYKSGQGDLVREFTDACREFGIKAGIYLSPWDRHEPSYGDSPRYNEYFMNQLTELATQYGEISCFWFDGACAEGPNGKKQEYDWDGYFGLLRKLCPNAMISDVGPDARWCGNEAGNGREAEWSVLNVNKSILAYNQENARLEDLGSLEKLGDGAHLQWYPSEVDTSIRPGWFYHDSEDGEVKSLKKLFNIYVNSVGGNAVLLLNIPPDTRGLFHEKDVERLAELKQYLDNAFTENLASAAKLSASAEKAGFPVVNVLEDNGYWTTEDWTDTAEITLDFPAEVKFNSVMLQEQITVGQRISSFAVDYFNGSEWVDCTAGKTVGHKKILVFDEVATTRARLRITGSRVCPTLKFLGLYLLPEIIDDKSGYHVTVDRNKWRIADVSSSTEGCEPEKLYDGNPDTCWKTRNTGMPQEIIIDMGKMIELEALTYLPVQNSDEGHILNFEIYLAPEVDTLNNPAYAGEFSNTVNNPIEQKVVFQDCAKGRYLKLKILSTNGGFDFAAAADLNIIPAE
jgi:alpha-L-fucosidase